MDLSLIKRIRVEFLCRYNRAEVTTQIALIGFAMFVCFAGSIYAKEVLNLSHSVWRYVMIAPLFIGVFSGFGAMCLSLLLVFSPIDMPLKKSVVAIILFFAAKFLISLWCMAHPPAICNDVADWIDFWVTENYIIYGFCCAYLAMWFITELVRCIKPKVQAVRSPQCRKSADTSSSDVLSGLSDAQLTALAKTPNVQEQILLCLITRGRYTFHEAMELKQHNCTQKTNDLAPV